MPTSSPIAATRTFTPTQGLDAAALLAGGSGKVASGGFASVVNQLVGPASAPAGTATTMVGTAADALVAADPGVTQPAGPQPAAPAQLLVPAAAGSPSPLTADASLSKAAATPRSPATGKKSAPQSDADAAVPTPALATPTDTAASPLTAVAPPTPPTPTPATPQPAPTLTTGNGQAAIPETSAASSAPLVAASTATPMSASPIPAAKGPATAAPTSPAANEAPRQVADDPKQATAPTRIADQRSVAAQSRLSDGPEQDEADETASVTTGERPAAASNPTASILPDRNLAAALPQAPQAVAPAAAASAPTAVPVAGPGAVPVANRASVATGVRQAQQAAASPIGPTKDAAAEPSSPIPAIPSEQPAALPVAAAPVPTSAAPTTEARQVAAPASATPTPAAQVAQAIVEPVKVMLTKPDHDPAVPHVTTIQITPVELGRVDIRIERPADGPAKIQLVAERADTLSRLVQDQSQLNQALDGAGLPQHSRTIEFSLAPAPTSSDSLASQFSGGNAAGGNPSGGFSQRQGGRYAGQDLQFSDDTAGLSAATSRALRSGIDITA